MTENNFKCLRCGRLATLPWEAAWCLHHSSNFQPRPPDWVDSDWKRMVPVLSVETGPLPFEGTQWYVSEQRNPFSYPGNTIPGKDKRGVRIVAGPMTRTEAYADAAARPTDEGIPAHGHSFHAVPGDLRYEEDE